MGLNNSAESLASNDLVVRFDLTTATDVAQKEKELTNEKLQKVFFLTDTSYGKLKTTYYYTENNGELYGNDDVVQVYSVIPQNGKVKFTLTGVGTYNLSIGKEYLVNRQGNFKLHVISDFRYNYDGKKLTLRKKNKPKNITINSSNSSINNIKNFSSNAINVDNTVNNDKIINNEVEAYKIISENNLKNNATNTIISDTADTDSLENNYNAINNDTSAYKINSENDLINIANIVNSGNDLSNVEVVFEKDIIITKEFPVIAESSSNEFNGTLNGNKHKITVAKPENLKCLIGYLGKNGSIKSLTINTCTLCNSNLCRIVENNNGSITDCKVTENLINIISQNVRCNKEQDKNKPIDRHAHLANILKKEMPDVIGFQEAGKNDWLNFLVNDLKDDFMCIGYENAMTKTAYDATPIFFRKNKFNLINSGVFWYNNNKEHYNKCQRFDEEIDKCNVQKRRYRVNHWAQLELKSTNQRFFIFNTHFPLGTDERRLLAIDILKERIASINDNLSCPFFVTGDYNMEPNSDPYKKMTDWKSNLVCPAYTKRDISSTNSNSIPSTTVSDLALTATVDETNNSNTFNGFKIRPRTRIDFCFGSSDLINVPSYKVILDTYTDSTGAKCPPSDHYGIKHTIDLK